MQTSTLAIAAIVLGGLAFLWALTLQLRTSRLSSRYNRLLSGVNAGNLEEVMSLHVGRINDHEQRLKELDGGLRALDGVLRTAIQRVGMVRFNPFDETGGDQSFAIAMLDQQGNGVVLSSLHSRTDTRVYAKPVEDWHSRYTLSHEEQEALNQAQSGRLIEQAR